MSEPVINSSFSKASIELKTNSLSIPGISGTTGLAPIAKITISIFSFKIYSGVALIPNLSSILFFIISFS